MKEVSGWGHRSLVELQNRGFLSFGTFSLVRLYQINAGSSEGAANKLDLTPIAPRR